MNEPKFKAGDHIKKINVSRYDPNHGGIIEYVNDQYNENYYGIRWKYFIRQVIAYDWDQIDNKYELDENPKEYKLKYLQIEDEGYVWSIPLEYIADDRAKYYVYIDSETTYQDEFEYLMSDDYEAKDWYLNNMNFSDISDRAKLIKIPEKRKEPNLDTMTVKIKDVE